MWVHASIYFLAVKNAFLISSTSNLKVPVRSFAQPQTIKADLPELNCIQNGNENARTIKPWIVPKVGKSVGKDGQVMG